MFSKKERIEAALNRTPISPLPRGELFIYEDFLDLFLPTGDGYVSRLRAVAERLDLSAVGINLNRPDSDTLLNRRAFAQLDAYYTIGCINGPVESLMERHGFRDAMLSLRKNPTLLAAIADEICCNTDMLARKARDNGLSAITIADDIAGNQGLFFSLKQLTEMVLPIYAKLAETIRNNNLVAFFHSDGDMRPVFPLLAQAGYDCLHPVDNVAGLTLEEVKEKWSKHACFMGNIDLLAWSDERITEEVLRSHTLFPSGGLIIGSTSGLSLATANKIAALYPDWRPPGQEGERYGSFSN